MDTTSNQRKQREEEFYFQRFLALNDDLRNNEIVTPIGHATPDRLIHVAGKRVGLDLTKYFIDEGSSETDGSLIQKEESDFEKLVREAQRRFEQYLPLPLHLTFIKAHNFHFVNGQARKLKNNITDKIVAMVKDSLDNSPSRAYYDWRELFPYDLQNVFSHVHISHLPQGWDSLWSMGGGGAIPTIEYSNVEAIVRRKESKLDGYLQVCDESWLLIHTALNGGMSSWVNIEYTKEQIVKYRFKSRFSKIFFLESRSNNLIEFPSHNEID